MGSPAPHLPSRRNDRPHLHNGGGPLEADAGGAPAAARPASLASATPALPAPATTPMKPVLRGSAGPVVSHGAADDSPLAKSLALLGSMRSSQARELAEHSRLHQQQMEAWKQLPQVASRTLGPRAPSQATGGAPSLGPPAPPHPSSSATSAPTAAWTGGYTTAMAVTTTAPGHSSVTKGATVGPKLYPDSPTRLPPPSEAPLAPPQPRQQDEVDSSAAPCPHLRPPFPLLRPTVVLFTLTTHPCSSGPLET
jgi:hypothetical protein